MSQLKQKQEEEKITPPAGTDILDCYCGNIITDEEIDCPHCDDHHCSQQCVDSCPKNRVAGFKVGDVVYINNNDSELFSLQDIKERKHEVQAYIVSLENSSEGLWVASEKSLALKLKKYEDNGKTDQTSQSLKSEEGDTDLTKLPGIGDAKAELFVKAGFPTIESIAAADITELRRKIMGVGNKTAADIIEFAQVLINGTEKSDGPDESNGTTPDLKEVKSDDTRELIGELWKLSEKIKHGQNNGKIGDTAEEVKRVNKIWTLLEDREITENRGNLLLMINEETNQVIPNSILEKIPDSCFEKFSREKEVQPVSLEVENDGVPQGTVDPKEETKESRLLDNKDDIIRINSKVTIKGIDDIPTTGIYKVTNFKPSTDEIQILLRPDGDKVWVDKAAATKVIYHKYECSDCGISCNYPHDQWKPRCHGCYLKQEGGLAEAKEAPKIKEKKQTFKEATDPFVESESEPEINPTDGTLQVAKPEICVGCNQPLSEDDEVDFIQCELGCNSLIHDQDQCLDAHADDAHLDEPLDDDSEVEEKMKCPQCNCKVSTKDFRCSHCNRYFDDQHCLRNHYQSILNEEVKNSKASLYNIEQEFQVLFGRIETPKYEEVLSSIRELMAEYDNVDDYEQLLDANFRLTEINDLTLDLINEFEPTDLVCRGCQQGFENLADAISCDLCPSSLHDNEKCREDHTESHKKFAALVQYQDKYYGPVPAYLIDNDRFQPRFSTKDSIDAAFLKSIKEHGEKHPTGNYEPVKLAMINSRLLAVSGHRRTMACLMLGYDVLSVIELMTEEEADKQAFGSFNRKELNVLEEMYAYLHRSDKYGWPDDRIAQVFGSNRSRVNVLRNAAALFDPDVLADIILESEEYKDEEGNIRIRRKPKSKTFSYLRAIAKLEDPELAHIYLEMAFDKNWSTESIGKIITVHQSIEKFAENIDPEIKNIKFTKSEWREPDKTFEFENISLHELMKEFEEQNISNYQIYTKAIECYENKYKLILADIGIDVNYLLKLKFINSRLSDTDFDWNHAYLVQAWDVERDLLDLRKELMDRIDKLEDDIPWGYEYKAKIMELKENVRAVESKEGLDKLTPEIENQEYLFKDYLQKKKISEEESSASKKKKVQSIEKDVNCKFCGSQIKDSFLKNLLVCKDCGVSMIVEASHEDLEVEDEIIQANEYLEAADVLSFEDTLIEIDEVHSLDLSQWVLDLHAAKECYSSEIYQIAEELTDRVSNAGEIYREYCYDYFAYRDNKQGTVKNEKLDNNRTSYRGYPSSHLVPGTLFSLKKLSGEIEINHIGSNYNYMSSELFDQQIHLVHVVLLKAQNDAGDRFILVPRLMATPLENPPETTAEEVFAKEVSE